MNRGRPKAQLPVDELIADIESTGSVVASCQRLGVCDRTLFRHIRADAELRARVDAARRRGRESRFTHGSAGSHQRCHCEVCRFALAKRIASYRSDKTRVHCPECGRDIGTRAGQRLAHYAAPGVVCTGSEMSNGPIRIEGAA